MSAPAIAELPVRGTYRIAGTRSECRFVARGLFGLPVRGTMPVRRGTVAIRDGRAHVTAEVDPAGLATGIARRDAHLRSPQLLDVATHRSIRFEGAIAGEPTWVHGELTVHGETVPTALAVREIRRHPARVDVVAATRVNRHDFGVTALRAVIGRHVDVELTISLVAED